MLFSAAYREKPGLLQLWHLAHVSLITSSYALEEARRNLAEEVQKGRLVKLVQSMRLIKEPPNDLKMPSGINLPEKDRPILLAAIAGRATHLITGDLRDFGPYFFQKVEGVLILPPGAYLKE